MKNTDKGLTREIVLDREEGEEKEVVFFAGRDLPWEKSRSEGVRRGKLGHVEKSSCNDPNQEPGRKLACLPLFFVKVYLSFSSFSSLRYSLKLSGHLFYFPIPSSPETTSLHLYILISFTIFSSPPSCFLQCERSLIQQPTTHHHLIWPFQGLMIPLMGVTLVQRSIIEAETQRRGNMTERLSWRWHIQSSNRYTERQVLTHRHTDQERREETGRAGLTLPVSHENAGRQQTVDSEHFLMFCALPVGLTITEPGEQSAYFPTVLGSCDCN